MGSFGFIERVRRLNFLEGKLRFCSERGREFVIYLRRLFIGMKRVFLVD